MPHSRLREWRCRIVPAMAATAWVGPTHFGIDYLRDQMTTNPWWRHQMETFSALLAICAVNSPVTGEFPAQKPVTRSFDVFFDLRLNKRLSKQSWGWRFETPSRSLWRHCNVYALRPGQNGWHVADEIFKCISLNWILSILIQISQKCHQ